MGTETLLILGATFLAVSLLVYGIIAYQTHKQAIQDRFSKKKAQVKKVTVMRQDDRHGSIKNRSLQYLSSVGKWVVKDPANISQLRTTLIHGAFRHPSAPAVFFGIRATLAMSLPLPYLIYGYIMGVEAAINLTMVLLLAAFGYYTPVGLLNMSIRWRQDRIDRALPDVLDLMIISMEAGLSLQATMNRVSDEIKPVSRELHEELQITNAELRTGISRDRALKNLGERTGVTSVKSLTALMIQSEKMGASIAQALRTHADFVRVQRAQRAEEIAAKMPIKIIFPTLLCIFPSLFIVILGPAAISIYKTILS